MEFNNIVSIIALILLIILLVIYGVVYSKVSNKGYPYTQEVCPKLWSTDISGNCLNPGNSFPNGLAPGGWQSTTNTPGYINVPANGGFNPNHINWSTYKSAKSEICGKKVWSNENKIEWDGVSTYSSC